MKFKVTKLKQAEKEIAALTPKQQKELADDYNIIENKGIEFVKRRFLQKGLFEIKTNNVRSLFKYQENEIILIALVYQKQTNKVPQFYIDLAQKRLKET